MEKNKPTHSPLTREDKKEIMNMRNLIDSNTKSINKLKAEVSKMQMYIKNLHERSKLLRLSIDDL